jgi:Family of unknown function (DUF5808)
MSDSKDKPKTSGLRQLANLVGISLAIASIVQELRKPPRKRTWHGALFGRIPYDWRPPTLERVRDTFWQPESSRLLQPTVFGVGWGINFAALLAPLGHLRLR